MRLAGRIRSFDGRAAFSSWLYRVTLTAVRDFQRATQRRGRLAGAVQHLGDDLQAPDQEMALHIADIWRLLRQLPQKQRDSVMLVYAEKLSQAEAARIMGCEEPPLTWPVCFFRARAKLPARDAFYGVNKYGDHHAARSRPDRHLTRAGPASHPGRGIAARARRSQLLGLGSTGILCYRDPCPRHGVFRIGTDGTRGHPLSHEDQPEPHLRGKDRHLPQVRAAFAEGECLLASAQLEGDILVIAALHGPCPFSP